MLVKGEGEGLGFDTHKAVTSLDTMSSNFHVILRKNSYYLGKDIVIFHMDV